MSAVLRKSFADLRRRRLQTSVIALVTLLSALAATMALNLLVETDAPYDHAFAQANGPHLAVIFDASRASEAVVAATSHAAGVVQSVGPWPSTNTDIEFTLRNSDRGPAALSVTSNIVGRDRPDAAVDRLTLVAGRWVHVAGEIVLSRGLAGRTQTGVGDTVRVPNAAGSPTLTVVGIAASISPSTDAWVTTSSVASLPPAAASSKGPSAGMRWVVEYRLSNPSDVTAVAHAVSTISNQLPSGSVLGSVSWLDVRKKVDLTAAVMVPFLIAFSALGLLAAAFVISNVIAGVVIADRRQIGIMKSVGFTPYQVTGVLVMEVLIPVLVGCVLGIPLGTAASTPFLQQTAEALGLPAVFSDTVRVDFCVLGLVAGLALAASAVPAARAGRLSAVSAISVGSGPSTTRGAQTTAQLSRVPMPAAVRLGLAELAGRPVRAAMTGMAVLLGVATVVFAIGLTLSLQMVADHLGRAQQVQIDVYTAPDRPAPDVANLLRSQPGTARFVGEGHDKVTVPGIAAPIPFFGYDGDSSWLGYAMISGRWFTAPGEVVAPSHLVDVTGLRVGQSIMATINGQPKRLTLVGEVLDQTGDDLLLRGNWSDIIALDSSAVIDSYEVQLQQGADARRYASDLQTAGGGSLDVQTVRTFAAQTAFILIESVVSGLALVLAGIAATGVLNTVVLATRERRREIAILKAVGMDPGQVVVMVVSAVALVGLVAGMIGAPFGLLMHHQILGSMAEIATNTRVPASFYSVLGTFQLAALTLAGVAIAAVGAWLPAQWAARERVSAALQAE